jgi:hypothetical protein
MHFSSVPVCAAARLAKKTAEEEAKATAANAPGNSRQRCAFSQI